MAPKLLRWLALAGTVLLAAGALFAKRHQAALAIGAAEMAVLALTAHLFAFDLERRVALRYLRRGHPTRILRLGLRVSLGVLVAASVLFIGGHGHFRGFEAAGAFLIFAGGLGATLCLLLYLFSMFTAISTLGVALGVASLVVVLSVTSGFEREFQKKVLAVNGHLIVTGYGIPTPDEADQEALEMRRRLKGLPGLQKIENFSLSPGEVMIGKVGANLKGVDLPGGGGADLQHALVAGHVAALGEPATCLPKPLLPGDEPGPPEKAGRMALGVELAKKLGTKLGDCISILVPFPESGETTPPSYPFKVVGFFHFGFNEYDTHLAYVNIEDAKRLSGARQSIFGVELRFDDPMRALSLVEEAERRLGNEFKVMDWRSLNSNLFMALTLQKVVISIVLLIIMVVAAFNILASLYLIVLAKTREIAILNSMGARRASIVGIFLTAGAVVGITGGSLGLGLGLLLSGLVARFGYSLDPKVYLIERLPVQISAVEVLLVPAVAIGISLLATLYPAFKASRQRTVEGLRYD